MKNAIALDLVGVEEAYYILYDNNSIVKYKNNEEEKVIKLEFTATCLDVSDKNIAVGDSKGILRILDLEGQEES